MERAVLAAATDGRREDRPELWLQLLGAVFDLDCFPHLRDRSHVSQQQFNSARESARRAARSLEKKGPVEVTVARPPRRLPEWHGRQLWVRRPMTPAETALALKRRCEAERRYLMLLQDDTFNEQVRRVDWLSRYQAEAQGHFADLERWRGAHVDWIEARWAWDLRRL